jgi:hypothetical protein
LCSPAIESRVDGEFEGWDGKAPMAASCFLVNFSPWPLICDHLRSFCLVPGLVGLCLFQFFHALPGEPHHFRVMD